MEGKERTRKKQRYHDQLQDKWIRITWVPFRPRRHFSPPRSLSTITRLSSESSVMQRASMQWERKRTLDVIPKKNWMCKSTVWVGRIIHIHMNWLNYSVAHSDVQPRSHLFIYLTSSSLTKTNNPRSGSSAACIVKCFVSVHVCIHRLPVHTSPQW